MQLLLVEELTSGVLALDVPGWLDLAGEGAAMLQAIAEDAHDLPGWRVEVLWSRHLEPFPVPGVTVHVTDSPEHEQHLFADLAKQADRTFAIAPEFDRRLEQRRERVEAAGGCYIGSTLDALALCGDKLRLANHLRAHNVPTILTQPFNFERAEDELSRGASDGLVIKPRDGAGSMNTFHVRNADALRNAARAFEVSKTVPIVQPFIAGRAISIAAVVSTHGIELFPPASQRIEYGDQLRYSGGSVGGTPRDPALESLVRALLETISGLSGYVGIDIIIPADKTPPMIVEINPRLTTSYLGYRRLTPESLARRLIEPDGGYQPVKWRAGQINFGIEG